MKKLKYIIVCAGVIGTLFATGCRQEDMAPGKDFIENSVDEISNDTASNEMNLSVTHHDANNSDESDYSDHERKDWAYKNDINVTTEEFLSSFNDKSNQYTLSFDIKHKDKENVYFSFIDSDEHLNELKGEHVLTATQNVINQTITSITFSENNVNALDKEYDLTSSLEVIQSIFFAIRKHEGMNQFLEMAQFMNERANLNDLKRESELYLEDKSSRRFQASFSYEDIEIFVERSNEGVLFAVHPNGTIPSYLLTTDKAILNTIN